MQLVSYFKRFLEMGKMEFRTGIVYRLHFMASIIISPLILILYYFIWSSVFKNNAAGMILGYSFNDMITYYVLSMIVGHFIFNMIGNDLQEKITYGDLTQDLLKPFSIFSQFLSRTMADRAFALLVEVIPVFIISFLLFKLRIYSIAATLFFLVAMFLAFFINFMVGYMIGLVAFWTNKIESLQWLMFILVRFMSGEFIPLDFLGSTLLNISKFLPFYYIRYGAIEMFLGKDTIAQSFIFLLIQLAWIILLYFIIKVIWRYAIRKYGAVGG